MKYRSASLNCIDFAAFFMAVHDVHNEYSGWVILSRLPTWFFSPFLFLLPPSLHVFSQFIIPTTSLINPARNERAKNLGMSAAPAERIIAGKCIQSRENS